LDPSKTGSKVETAEVHEFLNAGQGDFKLKGILLKKGRD
jgi:hypothetical protein